MVLFCASCGHLSFFVVLFQFYLFFFGSFSSHTDPPKKPDIGKKQPKSQRCRRKRTTSKKNARKLAQLCSQIGVLSPKCKQLLGGGCFALGDIVLPHVGCFICRYMPASKRKKRKQKKKLAKKKCPCLSSGLSLLMFFPSLLRF